MYERDVAEKFKSAIPYPVHVMVNSAEIGWPDRLIQLPHSVIVAVEFKLLYLTKMNTFKVNYLKKEQAAWLAKWQRNGGYNCLFYGLITAMDKFLGYGLITCDHWDGWLLLSNKLFTLEKVNLVKTNNEIHALLLDWLRAKRVQLNVNTIPLTNEIEPVAVV